MQINQNQVNIERIQAADIPRNWHWISQLLAPSVAHDPSRTLDDVRGRLLSGESGLVSIHADGAAGVMVVDSEFDGDVFALTLAYVAGEVRGGSWRFIRFVRSIVSRFEDEARKLGCSELRLGGRDWSRVFWDFEHFDGMPNGLRKVL